MLVRREHGERDIRIESTRGHEFRADLLLDGGAHGRRFRDPDLDLHRALLVFLHRREDAGAKRGPEVVDLGRDCDITGEGIPGDHNRLRLLDVEVLDYDLGSAAELCADASLDE